MSDKGTEVLCKELQKSAVWREEGPEADLRGIRMHLRADAVSTSVTVETKVQIVFKD